MGVTYATIFPQVWRMEGLQMKHMYLEDLVTVSGQGWAALYPLLLQSGT